MKKKLLFIIGVIFLVMFTTACDEPVQIDGSSISDTGPVKDYPVVVSDITISGKPEKVTVLCASLADVIVSIGYETSLVLVTEEAVNEELESLPKISPNDVNSIIESGSTLVLGRDMTEEVKNALIEAEITVVEIPKAIDRTDYERLYSHVGAILNGASTGYNHALETAQRIFTTLDDLSRIIPESDIITTAAFIYDTDGNGVTGETIADTVMSYVGLTNALKGSTDGTYSFEQLSLANPNYIFCPVGYKEELISNPDFLDFSAVIEDKVFEIPEYYGYLEGTTIIDFATEIAGLVYPELLEEEGTDPVVPETTPSPSPIPSEPPSESSETYIHETLQLDDASDLVLAMQTRLSQLGYLTGEYTGYFNEETQEAVKNFQEQSSLDVTGIADNETLTQLYSENAPNISIEDATS